VPTYEYACTACGHRLEAVQSFSDDPLTVCPECGEALRKVYGAVGIVLKGSGFYKTDSRAAANGKSTNGKSRESSSASGDGASGSSGGTDGGSSEKSDAGAGTSAGKSEKKDSGESGAASKPAAAAAS
jgi:putative FmdB family regulatory protein